VRSLTLVDTALDGHVWSGDWLQRWRQITDAAKAGDLDAARQHWLGHALFRPALEQVQTATAIETMVARYSGWHWRERDPDSGPCRPIAEILSSIAIPTLMIVGERDLADFQNIAQRVAMTMPNVELRTIPKAGHMSNMESPQEFNRLLLEHLSG
jgi:pimeloyl-ACP methyl ester carboxylesterase